MRLGSGSAHLDLGAEAEFAHAAPESCECLARFENHEYPLRARTQRDAHVDP